MYNSDTELLFPPRVIPALRALRGDDWRDLLDGLLAQPPTGLDRLAFELLMVRMGSCNTCNADSYRAMRGCTTCAQQSVRRFRGSDQELLHTFDEMREEVKRFQEKSQADDA